LISPSSQNSPLLKPSTRGILKPSTPTYETSLESLIQSYKTFSSDQKFRRLVIDVLMTPPIPKVIEHKSPMNHCRLKFRDHVDQRRCSFSSFDNFDDGWQVGFTETENDAENDAENETDIREDLISIPSNEEEDQDYFSSAPLGGLVTARTNSTDSPLHSWTIPLPSAPLKFSNEIGKPSSKLNWSIFQSSSTSSSGDEENTSPNSLFDLPLYPADCPLMDDFPLSLDHPPPIARPEETNLPPAVKPRPFQGLFVGLMDVAKWIWAVFKHSRLID